jgi:predicted phage tail component-like protein
MITFDGYNLRDYVDKINDIQRPVLASRDHTFVDIPGMAGAIIARSKTGVRMINVAVQIFGRNKAEIRTKVDALAEVLMTENPASMVFDDEPQKTYWAIVTDETAFEELSRLGKATISFVCPDPFPKGATKTEVLTNNGSKTVTITGTAPTLPKFTVTFGATASFFEITHGTKKVRINFDFVAGTVLVIDHAENLVTINGTINNGAIALESDFFKVSKGSATFVCSNAGTGAVIDMEYIERWL